MKIGHLKFSQTPLLDLVAEFVMFSMTLAYRCVCVRACVRACACVCACVTRIYSGRTIHYVDVSVRV